LTHKIGTLIREHRPKNDVIPEHFSRLCEVFSPDQMFSIIFGLYLFNWKINENGRNCHPNEFNSENDLKNFLEKNPNTEYIHSCKIYCKK
jgi:hypothetical protein